MKAKKVIISILIVVISVLLGSTNVLAHPTKATVSGCEDVGWLEMENRHNKNTIIGYKFDSSATSEVKDATRAGAAMWNGTVTIAEKNITYIGTVHSDYLSYADWTAGVYDIQTDSSGHYTSLEDYG